MEPAVLILHDVLGRVVRAEEALEDGAADYAWAILRDLELDLAAYTEWRKAA